MNVRSIERARNLKFPCHGRNIGFFAGVKLIERLLYMSFNFDLRLRHFEWLWC
jgi:hypothetical protein